MASWPPRGPKKHPRSAQDPFKRPQDAPRGPKESPKRPPRRPKRRPRPPQEPSSSLQNSPKTPHLPPKTHQESPKPLQDQNFMEKSSQNGWKSWRTGAPDEICGKILSKSCGRSPGGSSSAVPPSLGGETPPVSGRVYLSRRLVLSCQSSLV